MRDDPPSGLTHEAEDHSNRQKREHAASANLAATSFWLPFAEISRADNIAVSTQLKFDKTNTIVFQNDSTEPVRRQRVKEPPGRRTS